MTDDRVDLTRFKISPMSGNNYFLWAAKMELMLRSKKVWTIVTAEETKPEDRDDKTLFEEKQNLALTYLLLTIEDAYVAPVITEKDPAVVWQRLKGLYAASSSAHAEALQSELHEIKMHDDESIRDFGNRITSLRNELAAAGEPIEDKELQRTLLRGISPCFQMQALVTRQSATTFDEAVGQLAAEEVRQKRNSNSGSTVSERLSDSIALSATGKEKCSHCGRPGHNKNNCFHNPNCPAYKPHFVRKPHGHNNTGHDLSTANYATLF